MRWCLDAVAVLLGLAVAGVIAWTLHQRGVQEALADEAAGEVRRLELEVKYRAATEAVDVNSRGWPKTVSASWFGAQPPTNVLLKGTRPWLEVAGPEDAGLLHPRIRMAVDETLAEFWYNPNQGVVRARVPILVSDEDATRLYNRINGTALASIFEVEPADESAGEPVAGSPATSDDSESAGVLREAEGGPVEEPVSGPEIQPKRSPRAGEPPGSGRDAKAQRPKRTTAPAHASKPSHP